MFVVGPIETSSGRLVGAVMAGEYIGDVVTRIASSTGSNVIIYEQLSGEPLGSSFSEEQGAIDQLPEAWLQETLTAEAGTPVRRIEIASVPYREALSPFTARDGSTVLGVLGVSLLDTTQVGAAQASQRQSQDTTRVVVILGAVGLFLIGVIGLVISHSITQPLVEIAQASQQVATGNLDIEVPERGGGEVTIVARSFNQMVRGLRQSTMNWDWEGNELPGAPREPWEEVETLPLPEIERASASILAIAISPRPAADPMRDPGQLAEQAWQRAEVLARIITEHRGRLHHFDGREGMASFGLPPQRQPVPVHALLGSHAAVAVVEELRSMDLASRTSAGSGFVVTTILHCGQVALTDMGQRYGLSPGIYGDTVNDAKELLGVAAQRQEGGVLITEAVHQHLASTRSQFIFGRHGVVSLRAPGGEIGVYEVQERRIRLIETEPPV
jgi:class 3 adenylate cyclase